MGVRFTVICPINGHQGYVDPKYLSQSLTYRGRGAQPPASATVYRAIWKPDTYTGIPSNPTCIQRETPEHLVKLDLKRSKQSDYNDN